MTSRVLRGAALAATVLGLALGADVPIADASSGKAVSSPPFQGQFTREGPGRTEVAPPFGPGVFHPNPTPDNDAPPFGEVFFPECCYPD